MIWRMLQNLIKGNIEMDFAKIWTLKIRLRLLKYDGFKFKFRIHLRFIIFMELADSVCQILFYRNHFTKIFSDNIWLFGEIKLKKIN